MKHFKFIVPDDVPCKYKLVRLFNKIESALDEHFKDRFSCVCCSSVDLLVTTDIVTDVLSIEIDLFFKTFYGSKILTIPLDFNMAKYRINLDNDLVYILRYINEDNILHYVKSLLH